MKFLDVLVKFSTISLPFSRFSNENSFVPEFVLNEISFTRLTIFTNVLVEVKMFESI